jgi:hypothetical protein
MSFLRMPQRDSQVRYERMDIEAEEVVRWNDGESVQWETPHLNKSMSRRQSTWSGSNRVAATLSHKSTYSDDGVCD